MYKVIYIDASRSIGELEIELNGAAEEGYRYIDMLSVNGKIVVITGQVSKKGRPAKKDDEAELGD